MKLYSQEAITEAGYLKQDSLYGGLGCMGEDGR